MKKVANKIREKYFFYLYVLTLFFGVLLCNITGLKATDEIFGLMLLALYSIFIFTTKSKKFNAGVCITFSIFIFYLCYSIYVAYNTRHAIILDFLIQIRPYLAFFIVSQISPTFSDSQKALLKRLCFIMWLFFIPIGIYGFVNPSFLYSTFGQMSNYTASISCLALVYLFCSNFSIRERFTFILILSTGLLSYNTEFYSIFLLACGIILYFHHPDVFKFNIRTGIAITVIMFIVVHITRVQITEYIVPTGDITSEYSTVNQPTLYQTSVNILKDFFPLGSGLASFGTYAAGLYSPELYSQYGLTTTEGLASQEYLSPADSYYPSLVQFGIIGIALYLFFWIFVVSKSLIHFKQKGDIKQFVLVLILVSLVFIENISDSFFTSNKGYFMMMFLGVLFGKKKKYIHFSDDKKTVMNPVQTSLLANSDEETEDTLVVENIIDELNENSAISATEETFHMPPIPIREEDLLEKEILEYSLQSSEKEDIEKITTEEIQDAEIATTTTEESPAEKEVNEEEYEDDDEYEYEDEDEDEDFDEEEEDEEYEENDNVEDQLISETSPVSDTTDGGIEEIENINETTDLNIRHEILSDTEDALQHTEDVPNTEHSTEESIDLANENRNTEVSAIAPDTERIESESALMDDELQSYDSLIDDDEDMLCLLSLVSDKDASIENNLPADMSSDNAENKLTEEHLIDLNIQHPEEKVVDSDMADVSEQQLEQIPEMSTGPTNIDTYTNNTIDLTNENGVENTFEETKPEITLISAQNTTHETTVETIPAPITDIEHPLPDDQQDNFEYANTTSTQQPIDIEKISDTHTDNHIPDAEQHIELTITDSLVDDDNLGDIPEQRLEQSPEVSADPTNIDTYTNNTFDLINGNGVENTFEETEPEITQISAQNTTHETTVETIPAPITDIEHPLTDDQQDHVEYANTTSTQQHIDIEKIPDTHTDNHIPDAEQHIELTITDSLVDDDSLEDIPEQRLEQSPEMSTSPTSIDMLINNNMADSPTEKEAKPIVEKTEPNTTVASVPNTTAEAVFKTPPVPASTNNTEATKTKQEVYLSGSENTKEEMRPLSIENSTQTIHQKEELPIINSTLETTTATENSSIEQNHSHIEETPPQEVSNKPVEITVQEPSGSTIANHNRITLPENDIPVQEKDTPIPQPTIKKEEELIPDELLTIAIGAELAQAKQESDLVKEYREMVDEYQFPEEKSDEIIVETTPTNTDAQNYTKYLDELFNEIKTNIKDDEENDTEDQIDYII